MSHRLDFFDAEIADRAKRLAASEKVLNGSSIGPYNRNEIEAQAEVLQADLTRLRQERAAILDEEDRYARAREAAQAEADLRKHAEDGDFWFRRFFTTLGIANAAGFVALTSGFLQSSERAATASLVVPPLVWFTVGMLSAGLIPLLLWLRSELNATSTKAEHEALEVERGPANERSYQETNWHLAKAGWYSNAAFLVRLAGFLCAATSAFMFLHAVGTAIGTMRGLYGG